MSATIQKIPPVNWQKVTDPTSCCVDEDCDRTPMYRVRLVFDLRGRTCFVYACSLHARKSVIDELLDES